jgi:very-short-patch-repair endonuclease
MDDNKQTDLPPTPSTGGGESVGEENKPYITADPYAYKTVFEFRAENKQKKPTQAETLLWELLRNKKLGVKFRRQHIIDIYIVDFVCLSKKLIIEVDGAYHNNRKEYDLIRTLVLNTKGFRLIRFTNQEVLHTTDKVINQIVEALSLL